jgi:hypothetical protein
VPHRHCVLDVVLLATCQCCVTTRAAACPNVMVVPSVIITMVVLCSTVLRCIGGHALVAPSNQQMLRRIMPLVHSHSSRLLCLSTSRASKLPRCCQNPFQGHQLAGCTRAAPSGRLHGAVHNNTVYVSGLYRLSLQQCSTPPAVAAAAHDSLRWHPTALMNADQYCQ